MPPLSSLADLVDALSDGRLRRSSATTAIRSLRTGSPSAVTMNIGCMTNSSPISSRPSREKVAEKVSEKVMELLHGYTPPDVLVDNLNNSVLAIREMSYYELDIARPAGEPTPPYDPSMPADQRQAVQQAWRELLRRASTTPPLPPQPMPPKK